MPAGPIWASRACKQVVDAGNALGSDLVVVLGDYFATHRFVTEVVPHAAWAAELARLRAPLGVHAILGNHDWWYGIDGVRDALADVRMPVMENDAVLLGDEGPPLLAGRPRRPDSPIGSGPANSAASTICPARSRQVTTDDPVILLVARAGHFHAKCRSASRSPSPATPMAARSACRWCRRSGRRRNTARASPMATSSSAAAT